jgi:putative tryptophan/tyrosine transport system substrate-binding protein
VHVRRRYLLTGLLATTTVAALRAAESDKVYRLAVCSPFGFDHRSHLFSRLGQLGYTEGQNLIVDRYVAGLRPEYYAQIAREMVQQRLGAIALAFDTQLISEVAKETRTIPIVAIIPSIDAGLVRNLSRPEGNITGVTGDAGIEMQGKLLDILRQAVPSASRIAFLSSRAEWEGAWGQTVREAGRWLGVSIIGIPMDRSASDAEYRQAFDTMARQSVQALMASGLPPNFEHRDLILELAVQYRLPSITWWTDIADQQVCLAYTPDYSTISISGRTKSAKL